MVYTKGKCDRMFSFYVKFWAQDFPYYFPYVLFWSSVWWRHLLGWSEEQERTFAYSGGYPWWRDPIAKRNELKYKRLIKDNNIDIMDVKWTGVPKTALFQAPQ